MPIKVQCRACEKRFTAPDKLAGKRVACPQCKQPIQIPAAAVKKEEAAVAAAPMWDDDDYELDVPAPQAAPAAPRPVAPLSSTSFRTSKTPKKQKDLSRLARWGLGAFSVMAFLGFGLKVASKLGIVEPLGKRASTYSAGSGVTPPQGTVTSSPDLPASAALLTPPPSVMPEPPAPQEVESGIMQRTVSLPIGEGQPGNASKLVIFTPSAPAAPRSLPCVFVGPAGTNLLVGTGDPDPNPPESLPYVKAGCAVVCFGLDGPLMNPQQPSEQEFKAAFVDFASSGAGMVNARNAVAYALAKLPEVDPARLYIAGHSSAGTLALLYAAHEPRLRGCIAYAPVSDLRAKFAGLESELGGMMLFVDKFSPRNHESNIRCPVFLFHALDDTNVPAKQSMDFAQRLQTLGKTIQLATVPTGNHYDSMVNEGVPQAIRWIQSHGATQPPAAAGAAPTTAAQPAGTSPAAAPSPAGTIAPPPAAPSATGTIPPPPAAPPATGTIPPPAAAPPATGTIPPPAAAPPATGTIPPPAAAPPAAGTVTPPPAGGS